MRRKKLSLKKKVAKPQQLNFNSILHPDLYWLGPYLEAVVDLVSFDRVKMITYYKNRCHHKNKHHLAITHKLGNNKTHKIFIRTDLPKEKRIPLDMDFQEDVLWYVAHELAHVHPEGWEHGNSHFHIMSQMFARFGEVLKKIGFEKDRNK